jgi:alpha-L-fucosidase 2
MTTPQSERVGSNVLWYEHPARSFLEALPVGNGWMGAMVYGRPECEQMSLNVDTLWSGERRVPQRGPFAADLRELRSRVFDEGDFAGADDVARRMQGPYMEAFQPVGWVELESATGELSAYRRELRLDEAVASVRYGIGGVRYEREVFISHPAGVFVVRMSADQKAKITSRIVLRSPHPATSGSSSGSAIWLSGRAPLHAAPSYLDEDLPIIYDAERGLPFHVELNAIAEGGELEADGTNLVVEKADSLLLLITIASGFSAYDGSSAEPGTLAARCKIILRNAGAQSYQRLRSAHVTDHQTLFRRANFRLDAAPAEDRPTDERVEAVKHQPDEDPLLYELFFNFGRYLLIACSRRGSQAANLQGIWNEDLRPPWSSNWTTNINLEMNYWLAETGNLSECHEPLFALVEDLAVAGQDTAQRYYDCRGWVAHHNVDLWRSTWPVGDGQGLPAWANWPMGGVWLCEHLWDHYAFSKDAAFLRDRAYPVIRGAAQFVLDALCFVDGHLETCPSTSPENSFVLADGRVASVSASTAMDLFLTRALFEHCIEAAEELEKGDDIIPALRQALIRLSEPKISSDGRLLEWAEDFAEAEPGHRHWSHLVGLYPGSKIVPGRTPALADAASRSLGRRLECGGGSTGWSRAWAVALAARLFDGELAYSSLGALIGSFVAPNLFGLHPPGVFQIDCNLGGAAAIIEMLVQSHEPDLVALLPALPRAWPNGSASGLRARGGATVALRWESGRLEDAELLLERAEVLRVRAPRGQQIVTAIGPDGQNVVDAPRQEVGVGPAGSGRYILRFGTPHSLGGTEGLISAQ